MTAWWIQHNINVGDSASKEGNLSTPNAITNLFTVAVVDMLRLFVSVPASFGPFLQPGLTADVTEGISTTDRIVNNPGAALLEGDKVRIVTPAPGYALVGTEPPASKEAHGRKEAPASNEHATK